MRDSDNVVCDWYDMSESKRESSGASTWDITRYYRYKPNILAGVRTTLEIVVGGPGSEFS